MCGYIGHDGSSSVPFRRIDLRQLRRSLQVSDSRRQEEHDAVQTVRAALAEDGIDGISFQAEISAEGGTVMRLFQWPPTARPAIGLGGYPGTLLKHEGAVPAPARRLPGPGPQAGPHPSADPVHLDRLLRERFPRATGASPEEIRAAEARLGMPLPDELRTLYQVIRSQDDTGEPRAGWDDPMYAIISSCLLSVRSAHIGNPVLSRQPDWHMAREVLTTPPGAAVQQLTGSPGWIVFGDDAGSRQFAIDMTPGPGGHPGQVISIPYDENATNLKAHSLTDFVQGTFAEDDVPDPDSAPGVARVYEDDQQQIEAIAHPDLEVLIMARGSGWGSATLSLAPLTGLPRLRTVCAEPGTLADPLELGRLTGLEYLETGPLEWRALLDAGAVPRTLLAAEITVRGNRSPGSDPARYIALANEILALWGNPQITETVVEGRLA